MTSHWIQYLIYDHKTKKNYLSKKIQAPKLRHLRNDLKPTLIIPLKLRNSLQTDNYLPVGFNPDLMDKTRIWCHQYFLRV